jgi:phosphoribosylamine--glycine ligase
MRVLVIGSGGREHALCWKLKQSPEIEELYCAPGNGGIAEVASCVPIAPEDTHELAEFAAGLSMDLTVVGPELPLTLGIVDEFNKRGLTIFGPNRLGAELEGSKVFSKQFMLRNGIPTPGADLCESEDEARAACKKRGFPVVLKADGLAAGKGVAILKNGEDMEQALQGFFRDRKFGNAASKVLVEECVEGEEVSFMVLVDGARILPLASAKDYKRLGEGDTGPNTGGMGAHSPAVILDKETSHKVMTEVIAPAVAGMAREGREYRGVLYAGLMLTEQGLKVLEFNCRFGDPETQAILPRMETDLLPLLLQSARGKFTTPKIEWKKEAVACVVVASGGYPESYAKGLPVEGLEAAGGVEGVTVFHSGTKQEDGRLVTSGGRVFNVCARGATLAQALSRAYLAVKDINFENREYRNDIGQSVLKRMHYA